MNGLEHFSSDITDIVSCKQCAVFCYMLALKHFPIAEMTCKGHFKVVHIIYQTIYHFLLGFHNNYVCILYYFQNIARLYLYLRCKGE